MKRTRPRPVAPSELPSATALPAPPPERAAALRSRGPGRGQNARGSWATAAALALALVLAALHLALRVEPALRYELLGPVFFVDAPFAARFAGVVGGWLEYAAAAIAQLSQYNAAGTAVFLTLWAMSAGLAGRIFQAAWPRGAGAGMLGWLTLLAALPGRYRGNLESALLGQALALGLAAAWAALPPKVDAGRWLGLLAAATGTFHLAGALPVGLLVATVALLEFTVRRRAGFALLCVLPASLVPLWMALRPGYEPLAAMRDWGDTPTTVLAAATYAFVPGWLALGAALDLARRLGGGGAGAEPAPRGRPGLRWAVGLALAAVCVWTALDTSRRAGARLDRAVARGAWSDARAAASDLRHWSPAARLQVTRAWYHAGRLPEDLFSIPQTRGPELLPGLEAGLEPSRALAGLLFELGQVNLAERYAHEALELDGSRPDLLRLLARINVVKDRPEAARVFLNRLRLAPFHQAEARQALADLTRDPRGLADPELAQVRGRWPPTDVPVSLLATEVLLRQLLTANRTNDLARACLVAHQLLSLDLDGLERDGAWRAPAGPGTLPRPCEEALLWHHQPGGTQPPAAGELPVRPEIVARFQRFLQIGGRHRGDPAAARAALAPEFGDTFWFYAVFGTTAPTAGSRPTPP